MQLAHRNSTPNKVVLKILSLMLGYIIWSIISQSHITTIEQSVPLYFYNVPQQTKVTAPENVTVALRGTKKVLHSLTTTPVAAHIDATTLKPGENRIVLSHTTLFLPTHIELLHTTPAPVVVLLEQA